MALIVQKFGGTSVGTPERIKAVAGRIAAFKAGGNQLVVVVSAMSGETNRLIALAKEVQAEPDPREYDVVVSTGEQVTIGLLCMALLERGVKARSYTGGQVGILTDSSHTKARIRKIDEERMRVLSSFQEQGEGTLITFEEDAKMEDAVISGIAFNRDEAKITVMRVPDRPGIAYAILGPISDANIDVDMIIQNAGVDGMTDLSFTVHRNEYQKALDVLNRRVKDHIKAADIRGDHKICKVSMVGVGMRTHAGIASQMFRTLAEEGINIQMISTSEIKISVVIDEKYMELAVRALHKAFGLDQAS